MPGLVAADRGFQLFTQVTDWIAWQHARWRVNAICDLLIYLYSLIMHALKLDAESSSLNRRRICSSVRGYGVDSRNF